MDSRGRLQNPAERAAHWRSAFDDSGEAAAYLAGPGGRARRDQLEEHRVALMAYCSRRLGPLDAEDAVQETLVRALHAFDKFEGRGTLQAWLYRIAKHVCIGMLEGRQRRAVPVDLGPTRDVITGTSRPLAEVTWIERPESRWRVVSSGDPAEISESREAVERALAAALRHLPPKQRGVVLLREVLQWKAGEVAELLGTSVASVNSALQRARATLEKRAPTADATISIDEAQKDIFERYVRAFERYDVAGLVQLVHDEARHRPKAANMTEDPAPRRDFGRLEDVA